MVRPIDSPLSRYRLSEGLTQEDLATTTGLSVHTISRIESGKRSPSFRATVLIAKAFNIEPSDYFDLVYQFWKADDV